MRIAASRKANAAILVLMGLSITVAFSEGI
jgi:hypothetical protein